MRYKISKYFRDEAWPEKINKVIEGHLSRIEKYNSSNAIWNYFYRQHFIGYINYSLITVFQKIIQSPLLDQRIEEYEKDYKCFLELSLKDVHNVFQQVPDLNPVYPAGLPKFKIHLQSEWDGRSVLELQEFLQLCRIHPEQLMIAKIEQNCIIITFAVLPHNVHSVVECLTDTEVTSILESHGVTVHCDELLLMYTTPSVADSSSSDNVSD